MMPACYIASNTTLQEVHLTLPKGVHPFGRSILVWLILFMYVFSIGFKQKAICTIINFKIVAIY